MNRISKFIGWLFFFAMQAAFDTFVIWGLVTYNLADTFVSDKTTIILIAVPTLIVVNIVLMIPAAIFSSGIFKKKERKPDFGMGRRFSGLFQKERKEEDVERWFKENITEEKIERWFKEKFNKEEE
ncbi:MAG TPA: hypothetical protein VMZ29_01120 [Candidatus Bathyarchaeia archaeon]|nr:hypothetical protein [Candidatus Bathyarchaeia archaeon]